MDFSDDEFPTELTLRFEPHGKISQYLSHYGEHFDDDYKAQPNEITLSVIAEDYTVGIGLTALTENGLLTRIGDFLEENGSKLVCLIGLWSFVEELDDFYVSFSAGVDGKQVIDQEKFDLWVEATKQKLIECSSLSDKIEFAGYIANRAKLKLDLTLKHYRKAAERSDARKARRARKSFSKAEFKVIGERRGYKCAYCGTHEDLEIDHIVPFSQGGEDTLDNLQLLCKKCNLAKGTNSDQVAREAHELALEKSKDEKEALELLDRMIAEAGKDKESEKEGPEKTKLAQLEAQKSGFRKSEVEGKWAHRLNAVTDEERKTKLLKMAKRLKDKGLL